MRLSRQFQASLFFFFNEKILRLQKHSQANINHQNKIKQTLNRKGNNFLHTQTSQRMKVSCFELRCYLCAQNLFVKKKISRLEIVLITLFYYTTDVYPFQPTYQAFIYMHLFLFVTICENLFESFLFLIICENLFF